MTDYKVRQDLQVGEKVKVFSWSKRNNGAFGMGWHFRKAEGIVKDIKRYKDGIIKEITVDNIIVKSDIQNDERSFPHYIPITAKAKKWINETTKKIWQIDYKSNTETWCIDRM